MGVPDGLVRLGRAGEQAGVHAVVLGDRRGSGLAGRLPRLERGDLHHPGARAVGVLGAVRDDERGPRGDGEVLAVGVEERHRVELDLVDVRGEHVGVPLGVDLRADLVGDELVLLAEEVEGVGEALVPGVAALGVDDRLDVLERGDVGGVVQRGRTLVVGQGAAHAEHPERGLAGGLRVEADRRRVPAALRVHRLDGGQECVEVVGGDLLVRHTRGVHHLLVQEDRRRLVELRRRPDLVLPADVVDDEGVPALVGHDVVRLEALVERLDEVLGRVGADVAAVHLDDVGDVAAGHAGGELLGVEGRGVELDLQVGERLLGVVEARLADVVGVVEGPGVDRPGRLGGEPAVRVAAASAVVAVVGATAGGEDQKDRRSCGDEPDVALVHVVPLRLSGARRRRRTVGGPPASG